MSIPDFANTEEALAFGSRAGMSVYIDLLKERARVLEQFIEAQGEQRLDALMPLATRAQLLREAAESFEEDCYGEHR